MNQEIMAQYLRAMGGNAPEALQQVLGQYMQANPQQQAMLAGVQPIQQPIQPQSGGFRNPQMPQGGMGSMQGQMPIQQGIIR